MRLTCALTILLAGCFSAMAQQTETGERRVPLSEPAVALDVNGAPVLEATLSTRALNGAPDSPVTNIRVVIKNVGATSYAYASGLITFYDGAGVCCGEGLFKADVISVNESFETDTPGIRIRCSPATRRIVATNLLSRIPPNAAAPAAAALPHPGLNLVISVDGEEHPIQLDKPMVVNLGNAQRTIVVREAP
jgi:hypothetical protein